MTTAFEKYNEAVKDTLLGLFPINALNNSRINFSRVMQVMTSPISTAKGPGGEGRKGHPNKYFSYPLSYPHSDFANV